MFHASTFRSLIRFSLLLITAFAVDHSCRATYCMAVQSDEVAKDDTDQEPQIDAPALKSRAELDKQFAQFHLQDGSIIGGNIKTPAIHIQTEFGMLTVPIERIIRITPGLASRPTIIGKIETLVEQLGDTEVAKQESAKKELLTMGVGIKSYLNRFKDDQNINRKKRLNEILALIAEQLAEEDESKSDGSSWIMGDSVTTTDFEIVGEIQEKQFELTSKFGVLKVQLEDLSLATREVSSQKPIIRKSVSVDAMAFYQTKPMSTKIRVNKGDRISINADGVIQWTNWNSSSSPEGITNRGQWNGINSGKLVARIGSDNSRCVQIGSKGDFVAKSSGTLYLGISMRDSYASNPGYTWTGEYKTKITINQGDSR